MVKALQNKQVERSITFSKKAGQETGKLMERIGESMQKAAEKYKTILKNSVTKESTH